MDTETIILIVTAIFIVAIIIYSLIKEFTANPDTTT